jgi:hypothetical protein
MNFPSGAPACSATSGYAECNANGGTTFVDAPPITGGDNSYDDVLAYADRNSLVSMFGTSVCQTVW